MVIASSTWVRPAQALIYTDSGEVRYFPPITRGRLPRALTFGDYESGPHCRAEESRMMNPFGLPEDIQEQESCLITSVSENFHIDDPPEEYTSFESEYSRHSIARDVRSYSYSDQEAPSMSTPTEQYMNNVLKRKESVLSSKQPYCSSASDTENGCLSPLLQSDYGPNLSLNDLVELYAKKLKAANEARLANREIGNKHNANITSKGPKVQEYDAPTKVSTELCHVANSPVMRGQHSSLKSQSQNDASNCKPMQLLALDIHLFLEKLDDIYLGEEKKSKCEDWLCLPSEELESILMDCCKETVEVVMMDLMD